MHTKIQIHTQKVFEIHTSDSWQYRWVIILCVILIFLFRWFPNFLVFHIVFLFHFFLNSPSCYCCIVHIFPSFLCIIKNYGEFDILPTCQLMNQPVPSMDANTSGQKWRSWSPWGSRQHGELACSPIPLMPVPEGYHGCSQLRSYTPWVAYRR